MREGYSRNQLGFLSKQPGIKLQFEKDNYWSYGNDFPTFLGRKNWIVGSTTFRQGVYLILIGKQHKCCNLSLTFFHAPLTSLRMVSPKAALPPLRVPL